MYYILRYFWTPHPLPRAVLSQTEQNGSRTRDFSGFLDSALPAGIQGSEPPERISLTPFRPVWNVQDRSWTLGLVAASGRFGEGAPEVRFGAGAGADPGRLVLQNVGATCRLSPPRFGAAPAEFIRLSSIGRRLRPTGLDSWPGSAALQPKCRSLDPPRLKPKPEFQNSSIR